MIGQDKGIDERVRVMLELELELGYVRMWDTNGKIKYNYLILFDAVVEQTKNVT